MKERIWRHVKDCFIVERFGHGRETYGYGSTVAAARADDEPIAWSHREVGGYIAAGTWIPYTEPAPTPDQTYRFRRRTRVEIGEMVFGRATTPCGWELRSVVDYPGNALQVGAYDNAGTCRSLELAARLFPIKTMTETITAPDLDTAWARVAATENLMLSQAQVLFELCGYTSGMRVKRRPDTTPVEQIQIQTTLLDPSDGPWVADPKVDTAPETTTTTAADLARSPVVRDMWLRWAGLKAPADEPARVRVVAGAPPAKRYTLHGLDQNWNLVQEEVVVRESFTVDAEPGSTSVTEERWLTGKGSIGPVMTMRVPLTESDPEYSAVAKLPDYKFRREASVYCQGEWDEWD